MSGNNNKWYKLVFKQIQPIHIGMGSYGVINETRIFIPGWTMWGALTKAHNLQEGNLSANQGLFANISCFFPCFDPEGKEENILFPQFKNGEFYLGDYSEDQFRAKFTDTFMSTAIALLSNTALEESLHELNVILPGAKADYAENEKEKQLYWVGIIEIDDIKKIPSKIYIGGDSKYGLGKMVWENKFNNDINEWTIKDGIIRNYLPINSNYKEVEGKIELLVEVDRPWDGAELRVKLRDEKGFFFVPGSKIKKEFKYVKRGILS